MIKRTIVYVDGYNLYYGLLRGTAYKWLDLVALFQKILKAQNPATDIVQVKFFTAPAKAKFASHGRKSPESQTEYHRALASLYGNQFLVINGYHEILVTPMIVYKDPPQLQKRVKVWHLEEKQTDVNLALHFYRDAAMSKADLMVLCSNDTDMEPALKMVREDFPGIEVGLVAPLPEPNGKNIRQVNKSLAQLSNWVRQYIRNDELIEAQLPDVVATKKKAARRPSYW